MNTLVSAYRSRSYRAFSGNTGGTRDDYGKAVHLLRRLKARGLSVSEADACFTVGCELGGHQWYKTELALLESVCADPEWVALIVGVTSQNVGVHMNALLAVRALEKIKDGTPFTGFKPAVASNLERAVSGYEIRGPKVVPFCANLLGNHELVTIDRHMVSVYGFQNQVPTPLQRKFITEDITQKAKDHGMLPAEVQAAVWVGHRVRQGVDVKFGGGCAERFLEIGHGVHDVVAPHRGSIEYIKSLKEKLG